MDLGGTWARACLFDDDKAVTRRLRAKACHWSRLGERLSRWNCGRLDRLVLGSTGLWGPAARQARRALAGLAREVKIFSDLELLRDAAFAGGPGIAVVAGTGAAAIGCDASGRRRRAGGWGPLLGDDGSAFWLGRAALRDATLRAALMKDPLELAHAPDPVRAVAALAPEVFSLAAKNRRADELLNEAAAHLAELADETARELSFRGPIPVSWRGGLFSDKRFLDAFLSELRNSGRRFQPLPPLLDPEVAAVLLYNLK